MNKPDRNYQASFTTPRAALPFRVTKLRGVEAISEVSSFDFEIALPHADAFEVSEALLGMRGRVAMACRGIERSISGIVRRVRPFTVEGEAQDRNRIRVGLVPQLWLLGRGNDYRIFQNVTVADVCKLIFQERTVGARFELLQSYATHDYLVQYDESDLAFIRRLLAMEGISFAFDHSDDDGEVVVVSDRPSFLGDLDPSLTIPWHADAGFAGEAPSVLTFAQSHRIRDEATVVSGFDYKRPLHPSRFDAAVKKGSDTAARGRRTRHLETRDTPRIDNGLVLARLDQDRAQAQLGVGTSSHARLTAGKRIEVTGGPVRDLEGSHHVVRVVHTFDEGAEISYRNRFASVPEGVSYRAPAPPRRIVQVVETAVVVGPEGQEIHTDELGRIKVHFHWDERGKNDDRASCWIRAAQPWTARVGDFNSSLV